MLQSEGQGAWCVVKPGADTEKLLDYEDFVCSKINCHGITDYGGSCYYPMRLRNYASVIINLYYQARGRHFSDCDFNGTGVIAVTDPSEFFYFSL